MSERNYVSSICQTEKGADRRHLCMKDSGDRGDRYAYGAVEPLTGESCFLILPYCNTVCMNVFLEVLSKQYLEDMILLCCDGAAWHKLKSLQAPENIERF